MFLRALKFLKSKLTESIMTVMMLFVMFLFLFLAMGVKNAAEYSIRSVKKGVTPIVEFKVDYEKWMEVYQENGIPRKDDGTIDYDNYGIITNQQIEALTKNDSRVEKISAIPALPLCEGIAFDVQAVNEDPNGYFVSINYRKQEYGTLLRLVPNYYPVFVEDDINVYTLMKGRYYDQTDLDNRNRVCVITQELADLNNLDIGDTIRFSIHNYYDDFSDTEEMLSFVDKEIVYPSFTIIGIITIDYPEPTENHVASYSSQLPYNTVLIPGTTYAHLSLYYYSEINNYLKYTGDEELPLADELDYIYYNCVSIQLADFSMIESFIDDHKNEIKDYQVLSSGLEIVDQLSRSVELISWTSNVFFWIILTNMVVIEILLLFLKTMKRLNEIALLISLGIRKSHIVFQFIIESAFIFTIGFILALLVSGSVCNFVGEKALSYQIQIENTSSVQSNYDGDEFLKMNGWGIGNASYIKSIDQNGFVKAFVVEIDGKIILYAMFLGIVVIIISTLIPLVIVLGVEPKKIMMEVN